MSEHQATGSVTKSALKADVSQPTARKYLAAGQTPEPLPAKRHWRTRPDPLAGIWPKAEAMLLAAPGLEARVRFEHLWTPAPWAVGAKHRRTFQRRVKQWRRQQGPDKEGFFAQDWIPGQARQLDWTNANELGITIGDPPYPHLRCHTVLPYSNWQWATRCQWESLLSLRHGLQEGVPRLGRVMQELRVDNSSAATHRLGAGRQRGFNPEFVSVCEHYGVTPKTIGIGCPNEHGDVASGNGHWKRQLHQHLLLRGSRNFDGEPDYDPILHGVLQGANDRRTVRLGEELAVMKLLPPTRLSDYDEGYCRVSSGSTIRVRKVGYSVPARLIGEEVKVEVHEQELKVYSGRELLFTLRRQRGNSGMVLDYRHVIGHLLRKPGAFERYRYREELFPTLVFRQAYDRLVAQQGSRKGSVAC